MKILFIHHSTGGNLIREGHLRDEIKKLNPQIEFWDHSYNLAPWFRYILAKFTHLKGLSDQDGKVTGIDYNIVLSNNSPREYAEIFSRSSVDTTLQSILEYDVIAFKNCYPTTKIVSDEQLNEDMRFYESIKDSVRKYPNKKFVLLTPPPLRKEMTNSIYAKRAVELVKWLKSEQFLSKINNLYIFDLFGHLADEAGFLKTEYTRFMMWDSHPNKEANIALAPVFSKYLVEIADVK